MTWEKHKITYKNGKTLRLDGEEYIVEELDLSKYQSQDFVEVQIEKGKIISIRFPPGMEPEGPSKVETPKEPETEISGTVGIITDKGIKISDGMYHLNGVDISQIKVGYDVKAVVSGSYLISIVHTPKPQEPKKGSGKIVSICLAPLEMTYEYTYTPPGEEKKTNKCSFNAFSHDAVEQMKEFKVGDWVSVTYTRQGKVQTLETIVKKTSFKGSYSAPDPRALYYQALSEPVLSVVKPSFKVNPSREEALSDLVFYLDCLDGAVQKVQGVKI